MTECRKVQELTKEFLKKLLKVKQFKERVIFQKNNLNFEPRRIRTKNIINSGIGNEIRMNIQTPFSLSDGIKIKPKKHYVKKIPQLMSPLVIQNENSKEKESLLNSKFSQRKLPKIDKQKTSEKYKEREREREKEKINNNKLKKIEEKKNDYKNNLKNRR